MWLLLVYCYIDIHVQGFYSRVIGNWDFPVECQKIRKFNGRKHKNIRLVFGHFDFCYLQTKISVFRSN